MPAQLVEHGFEIAGPTVERPDSADLGCRFYDTTLGRLLIWNGTAWVDVEGQVPYGETNGTAAGTGNVASETTGQVHRTVLTMTNLSITMTDATTAGCHGSQKIYDFPAGVIQILGCVTDLAITAGAGGITDTASVVGSVGTAAVGTDNATLTSTEANVVPSTAATLTAGAGNCDGESTASPILDGTGTATDLFLNFAVPDAGSSANDTLTVNGTVVVTWVNFGDN